MKRVSLIALLIFFYSVFVSAQDDSGGGTPNIGFGFKVGSLSGLSIKKYFGKSALDFTVGRLDGWNKINSTSFHDFEKFNNDLYYFVDGDSKIPLGLQIHYLSTRPFNFDQQFSWYYGIGAQMRALQVQYDYYTRSSTSETWSSVFASSNSISSNEYHIRGGIDWDVGLEYIFKKVPLGVFVDATLYMEIYSDPFEFSGMAGVGVRYNF